MLRHQKYYSIVIEYWTEGRLAVHIERNQEIWGWFDQAEIADLAKAGYYWRFIDEVQFIHGPFRSVTAAENHATSLFSD